MAKKKEYPGGVKLTAKKARELAVQEIGTAKGLEREPGAPGTTGSAGRLGKHQRRGRVPRGG